MDQRRARNRTWRRGRENEGTGHGRISPGTINPSRPHLALQLQGAAEPLDRGGVVPLFDADGAGVLVAVAFLDRRTAGRGRAFADAASMVWLGVFFHSLLHVYAVVAPDAGRPGGRGVVEVAALLHHESRREDAAGGAVQRG